VGAYGSGFKANLIEVSLLTTLYGYYSYGHSIQPYSKLFVFVKLLVYVNKRPDLQCLSAAVLVAITAVLHVHFLKV
jgi:hypothetical protein